MTTFAPFARLLWFWIGLLSLVSLSPAQAVEPDELLDPDVAFALTVTARDADTVVASWAIAEGYYLYRERTHFVTTTPGITLGEPQFPAGKIKEDEFFGKMEIYHGGLAVVLPLERSADAPSTLQLDVTNQGCADAGICYPPQTRRVAVELPPLAAPAAAASAPVTAPVPAPVLAPAAPAATAPAATDGNLFVSEQDRIARMLVEQRFWAMPAFFGFGLLLAFTPCVFPMIPILSSIIVGQGARLTQRRAFTLSGTYVLAMAFTYTIAGVLAAMLGQNIQALFQNPWVLGTFSLLFVLLALSMFGLYDLQLPVSWQSKLSEISNKRKSGTYAGVAVMGLLSALIVGPCVAAPLIGVLTVIGLTGDAVLGGSALFVMSLGMGMPLLLVGASAGKLLPRAGRWMAKIKAVFGVLLIGVALWMLERILPEAVTMLLWAMLFIVTATFMGALHTLGKDAPPLQILSKGLGVAMLAYGVLLLVGVAAGGKDPLQPLLGVALVTGTGAVAESSPEKLAFKTIKTVADLDREIGQAAGRPVMLDFYADWCVSCKEMEKYTFPNPKVRAALQNTVLLKADVTANDEADQALLERFGIIGPPAILFFGPDGQEKPAYRVVGFMQAEAFASHLDRALRMDRAALASVGF